MKREIKFRAWDGEKFIYPHEEHINTYWSWGEDNIGFSGELRREKYQELRCIHLTCQEALFDEKYIEKYPIMQFTGLKDKNGKEIFESDICKYNSRGLGFKGHVVSNGWEFYYEPIDQFSKDYDHMSYSPGHEIEVIGNIYENPELLDGTDKK